jgi:biopolymer transport protein ExbB/TolQ
MDPITLFLIGIGAVALVGIVLFFLVSENAKAYQREIEESNRKLEELRRKVEDEERKRKQLEDEKGRREVEDFFKEIKQELNQEEEKWRKETSIASALVEIAADPSIPNIAKLVRLIYESIFLKNHLKDPQNARYEARRRVDTFVERAEQVLYKK